MRLFKLSLPRAAGRIDELRGSVRSGQSLGKTLNRFPARIRRAADLDRFETDAFHAAKSPAIHGADMQPLAVRPRRQAPRHVAQGNQVFNGRVNHDPFAADLEPT